MLYYTIRALKILKVICGCSSMVECQPSKLNTWVRFPSPAFFAQIAQSVEQRTENPRVTGSIPVLGILPNMREW